MTIVKIGPRYTIEIDQVTKNKWSGFLQGFDDATIYQTWSYGAVRWGRDHLSHLVLKRDEKVVGLAQLRIIKLPVFRTGMAYLPWGPLWHVHGEEENPENIIYMIRALREEYVVRRRFFLRIKPNEIETDNDKIRSFFEEQRFLQKPSSYRTFLLDLTPSLEELRKRLDQKWRNHLNRAEKNNLTLIEGKDIELYDKFIIMYNQMLSRKQFESSADINEFRAIQEDLPDLQKMKIIVCECNGEPLSALIGSAIGDTGIYLLGATSDNGMKTKGSYVIQWRMIQWLKEIGCRYYDLGGIDPGKNPGVHNFKAGLRGRDVYHIGQFDVCQSLGGLSLVVLGDEVRLTWKKIRDILKRLKNRIYDASKFRKGGGKKNCESTVC